MVLANSRVGIRRRICRCSWDAHHANVVVRLFSTEPMVEQSASSSHISTGQPKQQPITRMGLGRLVASSFDHGQTTQLTTVAHQAPARLIPLLHSTPVESQGAAIAYLGNYGGGLLPGDVLQYNIHVQSHARLGVLTQGSNRIYKQSQTLQPHHQQQRQQPRLSQTHVSATVDAHGLLVVAPDPVTPFGHSAFSQVQTIWLHPQASLCWVDWFSSGRFANGEIWEQQLLETSTELHIVESPQQQQQHCPILVDTILLKGGQPGLQWGDWQCHAYATVYLYGEALETVKSRFQQLQDFLLALHTNIRQDATKSSFFNNNHDPQPTQQEELEHLRNRLTDHRVILSVSRVVTSSHHDVPLYAVRIAAMSNEDVYRILHYCLQPLGKTKTDDGNHSVDKNGRSLFGFEFYKDRIRASRSAPVPPPSRRDDDVDGASFTKTSVERVSSRKSHWGQQNNNQISNDVTPRLQPPMNSEAQWTMLLLADSSLPTGSFAHSNGLEAAAQMGLLLSDNTTHRERLETFVNTSVESFLKQSGPIVRAIHRLLVDLHKNEGEEDDTNEEEHMASHLCQQLDALNTRYHSSIASNGPACMASLDQGKSLLRVALCWAQDQVRDQEQKPHSGTTAREARRRLACFKAMDRQFSSVGEDAVGGHFVTVFGVTSALLGLSPDHAGTLLGYCYARDTISAAVRLNLVGPLSSVSLLANAYEAAVKNKWEQRNNEREEEEASFTKLHLPSCAPVLDAVQPCHDRLAVRLFRS